MKPIKLTIFNFKEYNSYSILLNQLFNFHITEPQVMEQFPTILNRMTIYIIPDKTNRVLAFGMLKTYRNFTFNNKQDGLIENIVVHRNHRRKGLGTKIINCLIKEAKIQACYGVRLYTDEKNLMFYGSLGFKCHQNSMRVLLV